MKKKRKFLAGSGGMPPSTSTHPSPQTTLNVKTKICAIRGILKANLKKHSTLKFMMNISFVHSICIHRSIILIFLEKKVCLSIFFHGKDIFLRFSMFISVSILVSATNSRLWLDHMSKPIPKPSQTHFKTPLSNNNSQECALKCQG